MIYYEFFPKYVFWKKSRFLPRIDSVTLHISKEFWWHRIFGSTTIFWDRKFWSAWSRGMHGEVSWPILYSIYIVILHIISIRNGMSLDILFWLTFFPVKHHCEIWMLHHSQQVSSCQPSQFLINYIFGPEHPPLASGTHYQLIGETKFIECSPL